MFTPSEVAGSQIRHLLKKSGRTQGDLADALGIAQQAVSKRLLGQVPFDVNELAAAAEFLDVPLSSLLPSSKAAS